MIDKKEERELLKLYICRAMNFNIDIFSPENFRRRELSMARNLYAMYCIELHLGTGASAAEYNLHGSMFHGFRNNIIGSLNNTTGNRFGRLYELFIDRINQQLANPEVDYHFPPVDLKGVPRVPRNNLPTTTETGVPLSVRMKTPYGYINQAGEIILRP